MPGQVRLSSASEDDSGGFFSIKSRTADPRHFNSDPDPAVLSYVDLDPDPGPASHQSDTDLRPLVCRPTLDPFGASAALLGSLASKASKF